MSLTIDLKTPWKRQLVDTLHAIATMIEVSGNETITVQLKVTFNPKEDGSVEK